MEKTITRNGKQFKLQYLYLIFRHGDRAPVVYLPDEPNVDYWPEGLGNLTNKGKLQTFNLGKLLRQRYNKFLGDKYISKNVYVRSTDMDRTLMSAQCCLAGMYPPNEEEAFLQGLHWQPIPVHTKPWTEDELRIKFPTTLQKPPGGVYYNSTHEKLYETLHNNQDLFETIGTLGKCNDHFTLRLFMLETILIMNNHHLEIRNEFKNRIPVLTELFKSSLLLLCIYNDEIREPAVNLLKDILEDVQNLIENEESSRKTKLYSMSDANIVTLLFALTNEAIICPYASCVMLEFYKSTENSTEFCVKVLFLNDHNKDPLELKVFEQKEEVCSFENFKQVAENYMKL